MIREREKKEVKGKRLKNSGTKKAGAFNDYGIIGEKKEIKRKRKRERKREKSVMKRNRERERKRKESGRKRRTKGIEGIKEKVG